GHPHALYKLGEMLCAGVLIAPDAAQGIELLRKAAVQKETQAYAPLAAALLKKNEAEESFYWAAQAAPFGNDRGFSQSLLAQAYKNVDNHHMAALWAKYAADQGDRKAADLLTELRRRGVTPESAVPQLTKSGANARDIIGGKTVALRRANTVCIDM